MRQRRNPVSRENQWDSLQFLSVKESNNIFKELGVDYIIEGGQTMNPSTDDMLKAIDEVHADTVFILPNNKNIVLAANQAKHLVEDKEIIVIPNKDCTTGNYSNHQLHAGCRCQNE